MTDKKGTLIDISQTLRHDLPVWPGDTSFGLAETWSMAAGSPVTVSKLTLSTHSGSHADSPKHYQQDGETSDQTDLSYYIGPAHVVDATGLHTDIIEPADLMPLLPAQFERLIIKLYKQFPKNQWDDHFTVISSHTVDFIAKRGCRLIAVDTPSLDPQMSKSMAAHKAVARANMRILEGLVLDDVAPGAYELIALPLKIAGADASPVRAVLRPISA